MNKRQLIKDLALTTAMITSLALQAFSQVSAGTKPRSTNRVYNPATEITVQGTVEKIRSVSWLRTKWQGTHLTLKAQSGVFDVHLGPASYLKDHGFTFAKGDEVEVTGSKVAYQHQGAIVAREVKMNGKVLTLRDAKGAPQWRGKRHRSVNAGSSGLQLIAPL